MLVKLTTEMVVARMLPNNTVASCPDVGKANYRNGSCPDVDIANYMDASCPDVR